MHKIPSRITRFYSSLSSSFPSRGDRNRSRWLLVFWTGAVMAMTAMFMPISNGLLAGRPVQAFSKQSREAGAVTFRDKGCEHCHGVDGIGTDRGPDLSGIGKRWKKDRIEQQIRDGGGGMPPFGDALQPDELKALVDYLSAKRKIHKTIQPPAAPKSSSDDTGL
jgi:mono/diheme cytochrome c family protein